jgi:4a-hydroxytetrahydrobiopterin dehydratase
MTRTTAFDDAEVAAALAASDAPAWELVDGRLVRVVECASFPAALEFVAAVGRLAEEADHHPDIDIRWHTVHLAVVTHDAGGLTELDFALARAVDELV